MQAPELPDNEDERIETLRSLNILDTPAHDRFDRYTRMSARMFDMPIALISLIDSDRQWFKSKVGLDAEETPRDVSFCGHAILGDGVFEVQNSRRDKRFRDNPLVLEQPHVTFYAGAPLEAPNGHKLGTLCLIDRVPRRLSDEEKIMLKNLADMVVREMVHYVDTETGLDNRNAVLDAGARCFELKPEERQFSLLLFDLTEVVISQVEADWRMPPGKIFAQLLRHHFPHALSIASLGREDFCVLLKHDSRFDEALATDHLCTETRELIHSNDRYKSFSALAGRIPYDPDKHDSIVDMLHEADELFFQRDAHLSRDAAEREKTGESLKRWRKTIF
ncbi:MAG: GAF domain-containing protein [Gammaproteobacteria bacterium]|nr:GAF domain-containing protein [Gammaproteobacteria bacterium]NNL50363.1 GAF domain-containing protein [Woeseiaceae bacterium]